MPAWSPWVSWFCFGFVSGCVPSHCALIRENSDLVFLCRPVDDCSLANPARELSLALSNPRPSSR